MIKHTPTSDARLKDLWCNTKTPASEIALKMGSGWTKNTVIGRAHNLDLPKRGNVSVRKPELRARIAAMHAEGKVVGAIAKELGIRSDHVRGFIQREEASRRRDYTPEIPSSLPSLAAVECAPVATIKAQEQQVLRLPTSPTRTCQYITSTDKPWRFCGHSAVFGKSYCREHYLVCYRTVGEREAA